MVKVRLSQMTITNSKFPPESFPIYSSYTYGTKVVSLNAQVPLNEKDMSTDNVELDYVNQLAT